MGTVSYTHLDVYKRQLPRRGPRQMLPEILTESKKANEKEECSSSKSERKQMCIRDSRMFEKKQIIYSETQGVCQVENIVSLSASRRERKIPYYVLRPVFDKSRVSYSPVENHQVKLRELFTREEAEALQGTEEMKKDEKLRQAVEYVLGRCV